MKFLITLLFSLSMAFSAVAQEKKEIVLSSDNTLVLNQAFSGSSTVELMQKATEMDSNLKSGYPMYLFLYTPGGSIQAGLELFEFLKGLNRPVHTITLFAASMGFQTVQNLGNRYIVEYGVLMSHYPRGGSSGEFGGTDMPSKRDSYDNLWKRRIDILDKKTVERTGGKQTIESYRKAYMFDLWLNGQEAVDQGYADDVVTIKCDGSLSGTTDMTEDYGFFRLHLTFSQCPMKTYPLKIGASLATNQGFMKLEDFIQKNGKFGETCFAKTEKSPAASTTSDSYYYSSPRYGNNYNSSSYDEDVKDEDKKPLDLCVQNKDVTLKAINDKKDERFKFHTRNLREHIEYSY